MSASISKEPKRRLGRPRGAGVVDPDDIIDETLRALAKGGYDALSMRAVGRSLGVSLATIQHHFGSKSELWQVAIERFLDEYMQRRRSPEEQNLSARFRNSLDISAKHPGLLAALLSDRSDGHEERFEFFAGGISELIEGAAQLIDQRQNQGVVASFDPDALLLLVILGFGAIGSSAASPASVKRLFGYDMSDTSDLERLAVNLEQIIGDGIYPRT